MSTKSFNEMTYEEKIAQTDAFLEGLNGEDWVRFLSDTKYEQYKSIICPFLDEDFIFVDIYNIAMPIVKIDMPLETPLVYELTCEYTTVFQSAEYAADNYRYKLAA